MVKALFRFEVTLARISASFGVEADSSSANALNLESMRSETVTVSNGEGSHVVRAEVLSLEDRSSTGF